MTLPERKYVCTDELLTNRTYYITHYEFDDENLSDYGYLKCFLSHFGQNWWHDEMEAILMGLGASSKKNGSRRYLVRSLLW